MAGTANPLFMGANPIPTSFCLIDFVFYSYHNLIMRREPRGGHNRKKINENFFKIWTPEMAYVLGFMYADGALLNTNNSSRTYYLQFSNNCLDLLSDIRKALQSDHKIYVKAPHVMKYRSKKYMCKMGYVLRIGNKLMYQDLINLGMQHRKSNIMTMPNVPRKYFLFFVRGYFDGDGCVSWHLSKGRKYPSLRVLFSSGSRVFLSKLSSLMSSYLNIPLGHLADNVGATNLVFQGHNAMRILNFIYTKLEIVPYLEYKYEKYLEYKNNLMGPRVRRQLTMV